MKNYLFILCFLFTVFIVKAQINLVPNPSFEDTLGSYPNNASQIRKAKHWQRAGYGTPDYFHTSATNSAVKVPSNLLGFQNPVDTNCQAYIGLQPYFRIAGPVKEYTSVKLINPLIQGEKYYVSFRTSLAESVTLASNKLGALFTTFDFNDTTIVYPINDFSHIYSNDIIIDKNSWTQISGSFIADSSYQYLTLGNFYSLSNTDTVHLISGIVTVSSYYYIDDVCVSVDSAFCINYTYSCALTSLEKIETIKPTIYPNPTNDIIYCKGITNGSKIFIYNNTGQLQKIGNFIDNSGIDISNFAKGFYLYSITDKQNETIKTGKFIKE